MNISEKRKKVITDFEYMRDMAELRALSKYSLEHPLSDTQYNRIMFLAKKWKIKR